MKTLKLLLSITLFSTLLSSCYTEVLVEDPIIDEPGISLAELLDSYELWYVNINETTGNGEVPFLQRAFTVSFRNGTLYANNNISGIGNNGNGYGIDVGAYGTDFTFVDINHDIDGYYPLRVDQLGINRIRLVDTSTNTSYYLTGYQRSNFDYDFVFYDNIHYFLQEFTAWKKVYTSQAGMLNAFDEENFLTFLSGGNDDTFLSSRDTVDTPIANLVYDYEGIYTIYDVENDPYLKVLTLDYDYLDNEYFELSVIDDGTIQLFHPDSGTTYEFEGRGYIQYLRSSSDGSFAKSKQTDKKRKKIKNKVFNKDDFKK
ncbi:nicotinic acid mononucleotide adenyltransferase [uncultured Kordia sp.]|uniref:nicotinic acid mononucleotide adenyltransferase n=1 Tax=uncultured Kordia sp. TaxID=507699 RepID=UPI00262D5881|nr:nicotinic acid mononucleotide adenyltransferase [uncultured Kordia sp.]